MNKKLYGAIWLLVGIPLLACGIGLAKGQATREAAAPTATPTAPALAASAQPPLGTPTRRPTSTPTTQPTMVPYTPPAGWQDHSAGGFSVALPERWQVIDVDQEGIAAIQANLKALDTEWARNTSQMLESEGMQEMMKFWATDPEPAGLGFASMNVTSQPTFIALKAKDVATQTKTAIERFGAEIVEVKSGLSINGLDAARLTVRLPFSAGSIKEYAYIFVQGRKVWAVTFGVDEEMWSDYEPVFATAALSFRVGVAQAP
jgi:hypothetical protein